MGIHTGTARVAEEGYVGVDVHRAARIAASGHGGQVLISASTAELVGTGGLRDLGYHRLKDLSEPERIYQLGDDDFPPLATLHRTNLPLPSTPFLGRRAGAGRGAGPAVARGRAAAHPDRAGRDGQDPPCAAHCRRAGRAVPARCLVGAACAPARSSAGLGERRASARCGGRPRRAHRGQVVAHRLRQLRAGGRGST